MHVHRTEPGARPQLPAWLADPFDLRGQAERSAARAARAGSPPALLPPPRNAQPTLSQVLQPSPQRPQPERVSPAVDQPMPAPRPRPAVLAYETEQRVYAAFAAGDISEAETEALIEALQGPKAPAVARVEDITPGPGSRQQRRHLQRQFGKREKVFGEGRPKPLRPDEKKRILAHARSLMPKTESGMHYGAITAKTYDVLRVLLYEFHNGRSGVCFPSYETIAKAANCSRSTVALAIRALETAGILSWVNRLVRVRQDGRTRVIRTSNAYHFNVPLKSGDERLRSSKSDDRSGTKTQEFPRETGSLKQEIERVHGVRSVRPG